MVGVEVIEPVYRGGIAIFLRLNQVDFELRELPREGEVAVAQNINTVLMRGYLRRQFDVARLQF